MPKYKNAVMQDGNARRKPTMPDIRDRVEQDRGLLKKIQQTELVKLYEYDYAMLDSLDKAAAVVPMIQDAADPKSFDASLKACREAVAAFETAWKNRTMAVTGIQVR